MADLLPVEEALARILTRVQSLPGENVPVDEALARAAAEPVVALRTLPTADNSAMDGYAVRSADGARALKIVERIFAGQKPAREIEPGQCARIMTGAFLPLGADAVVMQEKTRALEGEAVEILEAATAGTNVRLRGEDTREGTELLAAGASFGVPEIGLCWAQGISQVKVHRRPTVAIVSSGDELASVGTPHQGRIYDTNSPSLAMLVRRAGGIPRVLGIAPDRLEAVREKISAGLDADVLITIAGVSVGEKDFVRDAMRELGVQLDFWKVAMKPGKPLAFGQRNATLVFGLPGNPISVLVTFELFVRPALRALQGLDPSARRMPAIIGAPFKKAPGLRNFVRARASSERGRLIAMPLPNQSSGALTSAAGCTHLISVPPDVTDLKAGDSVEVMEVSWEA
jgi:molybdopterin molybdotransferase